MFLILALLLTAIAHDYTGCEHVIIGAGIGGIYTAHQLANTSFVSASKICIFEKNDRPGGRIYSFRNSEGRLMFELGGADYTPNSNMPILDSIKKAFNLSTICSSYLDPDCGDNSKFFAKVRNQPLQNQMKGTRNSSKIPYYLLKREQYDNINEFVSPWSVLDEQLPISEQEYDDLTSGNRTRAWIAINKLVHDMYNNKVPKTNLSYSNSDFRTALYNVTTGKKIVFSEEKWLSILQNVDEAENDSEDWLLHSSKLSLFSESLFGGYSGDLEETYSDASGNPIGYSTALETLLHNFTQHGGRIFYRHQLTGIKRPNNKKRFSLEMLDSTNTPMKLTAKTTVLNMGVPDLGRLSRDSILWTENSNFDYLLKTFGYAPAVKGFLHYEDPWWIRILQQTGDFFTTSEPIRYFENFQTWPDCDVEYFNQHYCPTWTMFTYVTGSQYATYWDSANLNRTDAPIWLDPNDPVTKQFLDEGHRQFVDVYAKKLRKAGVDPSTIAPPDRGVLAFWENGCSYGKTNNLNGRHNRQIRKPLHPENTPSQDGDQLCIANVDVSPLYGEAEGSLITALEALKLCYNVTVPNFPAAFYDNIINHVF